MEQQPTVNNQPDIRIPFAVKLFGSGFLTGYFPYASGTVGSAAALLFFLIPSFHGSFVIIPITAVFFILGGMAAGRMETQYGQDPRQVTIDEFVGMFISLWFVPVSLLNVGLAFLLFRILDILKPYPAGEFDKRPGGWNIMLDDVVAGLYTNFILQISLRFLN